MHYEDERCQKESEGIGTEDTEFEETGLDSRDSDGGMQHALLRHRQNRMRSVRVLLARGLSAKRGIVLAAGG
jgi:hypothetical protein